MNTRFTQSNTHSLTAKTSSHRLPTLSASQALNAQKSQRVQLSTGSKLLDSLLDDGLHARNPPLRSFTKRLVTSMSVDAPEDATGEGRGGVGKGKLTEICGPPGSGKTTLAIQVAANALLAGEKVTWIETAHPLPLGRLVSILEHNGDKDSQSTLHSIRIIKCPTLAHLLALVLHPSTIKSSHSFPEKGTGVLVIDNVSTLFSIAFPPGMDGEFVDKKGSLKGQIQPSERRFNIMTDLSIGLGKLAAMKNVVILVLNQLTTRIIRGVGAILQPAVGSPKWTNAFANRLLIFRHDIPKESLKTPEIASSMRYISILKAAGATYENEDGPIVSVVVGENGIGDVEYLPEIDPNDTTELSQVEKTPSHTPSVSTQPTQPEIHTSFVEFEDFPPLPKPRKRSLSDHGVSPVMNQGKRKKEIVDSEGEGEDGEVGEDEMYDLGNQQLDNSLEWIE